MKSLFVALLAVFWSFSTWALTFEERESEGVKITVATLDPAKENLSLFLNDERGAAFRRFDTLASWLKSQGHTLVFAMNAGMYHADFHPVGLLVIKGTVKAPLNTATGHGNFFMKPNGVFYVRQDGSAGVMESLQFAAANFAAEIATQSGPLLVHEGRMHPAFNPMSASRLVRNGVGVSADGLVHFAISNGPVSLHEFATFFRDVLRCPDALYLDGVVSSLYAPRLGRNDNSTQLGPIFGVVQ